MPRFQKLSSAPAVAACGMLVAACIAGCSGSQGTPPLSQSNPRQIFQWSRGGTMLGFGTHQRLEEALRDVARLPRATSAFKATSGKPAIWVDGADEIIGVSRNGESVVGNPIAVTSCYMSPGMKVDGHGNIWQSCADTYDSSNTYGPGVLEFDPQGNAVAQYNGGCPTNLPASECGFWYALGVDVAGTKTDIFSSLLYFEYQYECGKSYCYSVGTGFYYWPVAGGQGTLIEVQNAIAGYTISEVGYMDVDRSGNLWAYAYGQDVSTSTEGTGIIEVENPTGGSPKINLVVPFGSMAGDDYWGMVDVSNKGTVLNVTDPYNKTTYRWSLPNLTSLSNLGPCGGPLGGFDKSDGTLVQGATDEQLQFLTVKTNKCRVVKNKGIAGGESAAYARSDKTGNF